VKTQYEYIHFTKIADRPKTSIWECSTRHGDVLGRVKWFSGWRQYAFFPTSGIESVFSVGCLADIQAFIKELSDTRQRK